jgi:riboflavin kinase / FMN adenylyltransferase
MRLIKGIPNPALYKNGCVLTIGNFDGVHLGHVAVIKKLAQKGRELGLPVVIMLFEPQPMEYFLGAEAPPRLTRVREKIHRFATLPIDGLVVVRFNKTFAEQEPEDFIQSILVESLHVKHLVVGDDFRFGKNRQGDFALLHLKATEYGFTVEDTGSLVIQGNRVSSTLIRNALAKGDTAMAEAMLGYRFALCGRIVPGDQRGRMLGYPTANIKLSKSKAPVSGVYAVTMSGIADTPVPGVANIGVRPTVDDGNQTFLETYLFDFHRDVYGYQAKVHLLKKIRDEHKFHTLDELKAQIDKDVIEARKIFASQQ